MKKPAVEKKETTEAADVLAASGLQTYTRTLDGAVMVEIAPHSYLSAEHLAIAHGRSRITS